MVVIDEMAETIEGAAERNTGRWGRWIRLGRGGWRREVAQLKRWILQRLEWYDGEVLPPDAEFFGSGRLRR